MTAFPTVKNTSTSSIISSLDDVIEVVLGLVGLEPRLCLEVALVVRLLQLLEEYLEVPAMSTFQYN